MTWLRRLFGGRSGGAAPDDLGYAADPRAAAEAKAELLRLLRARSVRSALLVYEGGHDAGGVTEIAYSPEARCVAPERWTGAAVPAAEHVDMSDRRTICLPLDRRAARRRRPEVPAVASQWLTAITAEPSMMRSRPLSKQLEREESRA